MDSPHWLSFSDMRKRLRTYTAGRPLDAAVSLPMPTRRWGEPAYAVFVSAALRQPDQPVRQGPPDRWWLIAAAGGDVVLYALWRILPFAEGVTWETVTLPAVAGSIAEQRSALADLEVAMDHLVLPFFAGEPGDLQARKPLLHALEAHLSAPLIPQYRALAPDFFAWLAND